MPRLSYVALASLILAGPAAAQCADGTPPPCGTARAPAAGAPRRDPTIDDASWIILPFTNLSRSAEIDWLRDASANLLYLDLSRWSDLKVVDDERVADLLRANPETRDGKPVSLAAGLAIARRVGAGRLVMGDLLKVGAKTTVTAKVFEVRTGQRLRTANQGPTVQDSLIGSFGTLARNILNVDPTSPDAGKIGTASIAAYREYLAGVAALNRFELKPAREHFVAALARDSTFALAHYKLAVLIGWENPGDDAKLDHARLAARFSGALPPREKTLMSALVAFDNGEYGRACEAYGSLVRSDSTDVEALYGMGECLYHDNVIEAVGGDTTRLRYRGSWNAALRMFRRTLTIDPTFHLAFQHILDAYLGEGRNACLLKDPQAVRVESAATSCVDVYNSALRRDGDTLLMTPVSVRDATTLAAHAAEARRTSARSLNLRQGRQVATAWTDAAPDEPRAWLALARIQALLGELTEAEAAIAKVKLTDLTDAERGRAITTRAEVALKREHEAEFMAIVDSIAAMKSAGGAGNFAAFGRAVEGRMKTIDSIVVTQLRARGAPPTVVDYYRIEPRVLLGVGGDSAVAAERAMFDLVASAPAPTARRNATSQIATMLMFGLRMPRQAWPAIDSVPDPRLLPALALSRHDTTMLRAAAKALDSAAHAAAVANILDDGSSFVALDSYLVLGDTTAALGLARFVFEHTMKPVPLFSQVGSGFALPLFLWPRALLLRADLEAARGDKAVARAYYKRFIAMWNNADPALQPIVSRAKAALAALGPGSP